MPHKRILLVDDEEHIREVASMSLELTHGWEVTTAGSGLEAIAKASGALPDAILLDVMMPGLDGPSTFGVLQSEERTKSIPVILLTAKMQPADRRRFLELGVQGVIAKPFDPLKLAQEVAAVLRWDQ